MLKLFFVPVIWLTLASALLAEPAPIPGEDDPAFAEARQLWLDGDDLTALRALSDLAQDDNRAAQILLAQIASRGKLHGHATQVLPRKERVALLRMPGGLSGKSWLTAAMDEVPLAAALVQVTEVNEKVAAIAALLDLGETDDALIAAQSVIFQGGANEILPILVDRTDVLPKEAGHLLALATLEIGTGTYAGSARVASMIETGQELATRFAWIPPAPRPLIENVALRDGVLKYGPEVRSWAPLRQFCEAHCPDAPPACIAVGASLMSIDGPFPMRSPVERLIANDVYWNSARIEADLARSTPSLALYKDYFASVDACFVASMTPLQATYGRHP